MSLDFAQIKELLEILRNSNIGEFKLEQRDFSLNVRTDRYISHKTSSPANTVIATTIPTSSSVAPIATSPVVQTTPPPVSTAPIKEESTTPTPPATSSAKYIEIRSPMVGTFYRSAAPDKPPFVKVGDTVEQGATLCVIEAMKLFNNVTAEQSGRIVKVLLENAQPVEYDQPLFLIEPA